MEQIGTPRQPQSTTSNAQFNLILPSAGARQAVDMLLSGIRGALPALGEGQVIEVAGVIPALAAGPAEGEEVSQGVPANLEVKPTDPQPVVASVPASTTDGVLPELEVVQPVEAIVQATAPQAVVVEAVKTRIKPQQDVVREELRAVYEKAFPLK